MIIRHASVEDAFGLCEILNEIIEIGGTTANEEPLSYLQFCDYFLSGTGHICCFVAVDEAGVLMGFQTLGKHNKLPKSCADIATFVKVGLTQSGVGIALFKRTADHASQLGIESINATIRQDNTSGITYYSRIGFTNHSVAKNISLLDGTPIDRISKRYMV